MVICFIAINKKNGMPMVRHAALWELRRLCKSWLDLLQDTAIDAEHQAMLKSLNRHGLDFGFGKKLNH